jgi:putative heme-binding domain-containing protein
MPGFASRFSAAEIAAIADYVRSLDGAPVAKNDVAAGGVEPGKHTGRTLSVEATRGRELFFDATRVNSCRTCHTFDGRGGKVGPDLSRIGEQDEDVIRRSILDPGARVAPGFEKLQLVTLDGTRFTGVKRDEDETRVRFFDTTTMPPVSRSLLKSEIRFREILPGSAMPNQTGLSEAEVLELIAFLKNR